MLNRFAVVAIFLFNTSSDCRISPIKESIQKYGAKAQERHFSTQCSLSMAVCLRESGPPTETTAD